MQEMQHHDDLDMWMCCLQIVSVDMPHGLLQALPRVLQNAERQQCATAGLAERTQQQQQKHKLTHSSYLSFKKMRPQPCSSEQASRNDQPLTHSRPKGRVLRQ